MEGTKYLIRARVAAAGVVERNDVVGAIYGQTEGLLGDDLDLRSLQRASRVGRLDVEIDTSEGRSSGHVEIESRLDRVETALLAAALETIDQIGPCEASVEVETIEDVRAAKRREVVERAKELLAEGFDDGLDAADLIAEVRESVRAGRMTEYAGLPAGPRVEAGDAVIVVEGRADVGTLLGYGVKNAIAVEGTDVPDAVADLTRERTTTAFLDGDRGGDLILQELAQVGEVDYVAFAPEGRSVEDLSHREVREALREKVPIDAVFPEDAEAEERPPDGITTPTTVDGEESEPRDVESVESEGSGREVAVGSPEVKAGTGDAGTTTKTGGNGGVETRDGARGEADETARDESDATTEGESETADPETLGDHVEEVVGGGSGGVRLLDADFGTIADAAIEEAVEAIEAAEPAPAWIVLDGELTQRVLDVAAQRGVGGVVARETGAFVKQPTDVRIRTAESLLEA